jgi:predicted cupin superfamily sugar epimerase
MYSRVSRASTAIFYHVDRTNWGPFHQIKHTNRKDAPYPDEPVQYTMLLASFHYSKSILSTLPDFRGMNIAS